ncbi:restriction endonuclease [Nocardia sp. NPDC051570]|uniref:restriction endonuclease n=1 Tax=Nocardia sp. NPDC051570 TaxID=3364324 RepID=UPI0037BB30E0
MSNNESAVPYDELDTADLHVDRIYAGKTLNGRSLDPISKLFGVGVQGGIRFKGSAVDNAVRLVVLYSTGEDPDWRDQLDPQTGRLTYFGDNKRPGKDLLDTHLNGNLAFRNAFRDGRGSGQDRQLVSPFFYFERVSKKGSLVRFRGLAAPGAEAMTSSDELAAMWWSRDGQRFQNYCARFTILDAPVVSHTWIEGLLAGKPTLSDGCPPAWREWVESRTYRALVAPSTDTVRKPDKQVPTDMVGKDILRAIRRHFEGREDFEDFALAVWRLMAPETGPHTVAREERLGRHYVEGEYLIGPPGDQIPVGFVLEAVSGALDAPVTEVSRLSSRLRRREFGVFVTLSYFVEQVYHDVGEDSHPVALVCGSDVVETLRRQGFGDVASVRAWLDSRFPADQAASL